MTRPSRAARLAALALGAALALAAPARAQSILRDAETEALFADMMAPLAKAAGLPERDVKVVLVSDRSINAFVAGGQIVYVHAGLIENAKSANEVQGVLAHELGHITGGHILRGQEGMQQALGVQLISMVLGAVAIAAGAGEAGTGIMAAGQQAALGRYLAFSRVQETSADAAGATYLSRAGISGRGSIAFFKTLQNLEFRASVPQDDDQRYGRTHPMTSDRISTLSDLYARDPAWERPSDPVIEARFRRVKAKLSGFIEPDAARTIRKFPERDTSVPARVARAYAWHKSAYPAKALEEVGAILAATPDDPWTLELKGQVLLESGRPAEALAPLKRAFELTRAQPLIGALYGHALIATEDPARFEEAERVLRAAVSRDNDNPFAWYQLGVVHERRGDLPRAALASAERYLLTRQYPLALAQAERAVRGLPPGSHDAVRAQDVALVARAEVERARKDRRG